MRFANLPLLLVVLTCACSATSGATNQATGESAAVNTVAPAPANQDTPLPDANGAMPGAQTSGMLPPRLLDCTLGRITNFDPAREMSPAEYQFEGKHRIKLFLPPIPARTGPPPDPTQPAEPVDPRTKLVADPDNIAPGMPDHFDRVVDYWPSRVELSVAIESSRSRFLIVSDVDATAGTANLFMTTATDAVSWDLDHLYAGTCRIGTGGKTPPRKR